MYITMPIFLLYCKLCYFLRMRILLYFVFRVYYILALDASFR